MPKVARKVAIPRSVPSAGAFMPGKLFEPSTDWLKTRCNRGLGAEAHDFAREAASLPGERRLTLGLADQSRPRQAIGVGDGGVVGMAGIGGVVAGDDQRRYLEVLELV